VTSIKEKTIKGNKYLYAEYSFRLPDGRIKKLSKLIRSRSEADSKVIKDFFLKKEVEEYKKAVLDRYRPDSVFTQQKIEKIEGFRAEYRQIIRNLSKNQFKDVLDRFTVNFTYESNAIEGNSLTLKDVTLVLRENILPNGKDLREVYETKNTRSANDLLFSNKIHITIKDIINIHKVLVRDTGVPFGFKKLPNYLLMRDVKTTPPEKVEAEMNRLIRWYDDNKDKIHPLRLSAEFHAAFEKIHPFEDGNGRVGRILINAILLEQGYPPIIIRKTMRQPYFRALEASDNGHKERLMRFLIERMEKTFENFFQIYVKYL
jgi:Fic family protein